MLFSAVALLSCACCNRPEGGVTAGDNPAIANILARKSVRAYSERPVTDAQIDALLRCAMAAPTGMNVQPWSFVVLRDTSRYDAVFGDNFNMRIYRQASAVIVLCADTTVTRRPRGAAADAEPVTMPNPIWRDDMGACTENLLLCAESMGLGAVWTACYPFKDRYESVKAELGLPAQVLPYSVVAVGWPAAPDPPKDKYRPERIHYGRW